MQGSAKIWDLQCVASNLVNAGSRVCVCNQATCLLPPHIEMLLHCMVVDCTSWH